MQQLRLGLLLAGCARTPVRRGPRGLLIATGYRWRLPFAGAFTVGNVVIFRAGPAEAAANPVLLGHEERHCTQYAWCLGLPFLPLYFLAAGWSLARTGNPRLAELLRTPRRPGGRRLPGARQPGTSHDRAGNWARPPPNGTRPHDRQPQDHLRHRIRQCRGGAGPADRVDRRRMPPRERGRSLQRGRHASAAAITAELRRHGVDSADITTSGLNVRAEVNWQEGRGQTVTGYLASSTLSRPDPGPAASSQVLAAAVAAGGDDVRLNGLTLGFADPAAVDARAREAAWQDARTTAEHYAALAGAALGRVLSLTQQHRLPGADPGGEDAAGSRGGVAHRRGRRVRASPPPVGVVWELLG